MLNKISQLLNPIRKLHETIRNSVIEACENSSLEQMSEIAHEADDDTIYAIDKISEEILIDFFTKHISPQTSIVLIAEGLHGGKLILPLGTREEDCVWRIIIDPIDGTRGLMYQKRSGWILTGVAPNKGTTTNLRDIELAIQTEIPVVKQHLSDVVWAFKGNGAKAERFNRITKETTAIKLTPSRAHSIAHGFAMISRFFPGARDILASIDEEIIYETLGPVQPGKAHCFEDQYLCTGGQLYELMSGHDRFNADLRPLIEQKLKERDVVLGICCHPYDICTELIARELGVIITDEKGENLSAKLSTNEDVIWVGYANSFIRDQIEPHLLTALKNHNLI
ncbi:inositol monophosphatase [candidate division KSB1 bacterium]|nr:inositol monophosphatase [candidate division KSB1 bacterium]MBL7092392.1 inositol monophosphatase [candidate division KSB1 bacterium]